MHLTDLFPSAPAAPHLAYCTNVHPGENWQSTFAALQSHTLAVRQRVAPARPYAIGLRLSNEASLDLQEPSALTAFRRWLDRNDCYVFTINGFPYGRFHGGPVKENVFRPDWASPERLEYTQRLFSLLTELLPEGVEGSVSTLPGTFKGFAPTPEHLERVREQFWTCIRFIDALSERTGKRLHLGVEPEPLGWFETSAETVRFFEFMRESDPADERLGRILGVNYDACHLAVEYESAGDALARFAQAGIRLSKLHFSSALRLKPTPAALRRLRDFGDDVYLHQVVIADTGALRRIRDLPDALTWAAGQPPDQLGQEWRVHFHVPLTWEGDELFQTTSDHLLDLIAELRRNPALAPHIEIETYTWDVLPPELRKGSLVDSLSAEYAWSLERLGRQ